MVKYILFKEKNFISYLPVIDFIFFFAQEIDNKR